MFSKFTKLAPISWLLLPSDLLLFKYLLSTDCELIKSFLFLHIYSFWYEDSTHTSVCLECELGLISMNLQDSISEHLSTVNRWEREAQLWNSTVHIYSSYEQELPKPCFINQSIDSGHRRGTLSITRQELCQLQLRKITLKIHKALSKHGSNVCQYCAYNHVYFIVHSGTVTKQVMYNNECFDLITNKQRMISQRKRLGLLQGKHFAYTYCDWLFIK